MKISSGVGIIIVMLGSLAQAQLKPQAQQLDVKPSLADKEGIAIFRFENAGKYPVSITAIQPSCACTVAGLEKKTYAPGEKGQIKVSLPLADREGTHRKTVVVHTDDRSLPTLTLTMNLTVPQGLSLSPRFVYWKVGQEKAARSIKLSVPEGSGLKVISAKPKSSDIQAELKAVDGGREYLLSLQPLDTSRTCSAAIEIQTELEGKPARTYMAYARVIAEPAAQAAAPSTQPAKH